MTTAAGDAAAVRSTRRPRDQTRALLLAAAEDLLLERLQRDGEVGNPVAALRITDVLDSINARPGPPSAPLTTGAAYQIWSSQREFQDAFLDHLMAKVAMPWLGRLQQSVAAVMAQSLPFTDVVAALTKPGLLTEREEADLSLALGLTALVAPERIRAAEEQANADYVREFGALLAAMLAYGGRSMVPGRGIEDLVWAVEAVAAGSHLRSRSHPDVFDRPDAVGIKLGAAVNLAVILELTRPD